jgi:hypothetical protein
MLKFLKSKSVVGAVLALPGLAMAAGDAALKAGVSEGATSYMSNITDNVPAILGIVALVAAITLIMRLFKR